MTDHTRNTPISQPQDEVPQGEKPIRLLDFMGLPQYHVTTSNGVVYLATCYGYTLPSEKALPILQAMLSFYNTPESDSLVQDWNDKAWEREFGSTHQPKNIPKKEKDWSGFVYVLHCNGVYKIGLSKDVSQRITEIQPVMPYPVTVVFVIETIDMRALEIQLHEQYAGKRLNGEWFALTEQDIENIKAGEYDGQLAQRKDTP